MFRPTKNVFASLLFAVSFAPALAHAQSDNIEWLRQAYARAVYATVPGWTHNRQPQALLRAVVVVQFTNSGQGWQARVLRDNDQAPDATQRVREVIAATGVPDAGLPLSARERATGWTETWLFDSDGRFQLRTLALPQRGS